MSSETEPERLHLKWFSEARTEIRNLPRDVAMQILYCRDRYLINRNGDVKRLKPPLSGFRLRCGDYRVFFARTQRDGIVVTGVRNRREAYR